MTSNVFWTAVHVCWVSAVAGCGLMTTHVHGDWASRVLERLAVGMWIVSGLSVVVAFWCRILIDIWGFK